VKGPPQPKCWQNTGNISATLGNLASDVENDVSGQFSSADMQLLASDLNADVSAEMHAFVLIGCSFVDPIVALSLGGSGLSGGDRGRVALWIQGVEWRGFILVVCERVFQSAEKGNLARMKTDESG
jgi:hypothetical protein